MAGCVATGEGGYDSWDFIVYKLSPEGTYLWEWTVCSPQGAALLECSENPVATAVGGFRPLALVFTRTVPCASRASAQVAHNAVADAERPGDLIPNIATTMDHFCLCSLYSLLIEHYERELGLASTFRPREETSPFYRVQSDA